MMPLERPQKVASSSLVSVSEMKVLGIKVLAIGEMLDDQCRCSIPL